MMVNLLADMAAVDEARWIVRQHRPRPGFALTTEEFLRESELFGLPSTTVIEMVNRRFADLQAKGLPALLKRFMDIPLPQDKVCQLSIHRTRALQQASQEFWKQVRRMRIYSILQQGLSDQATERHIEDFDACISEAYRDECCDELEQLAATLHEKVHNSQARKEKVAFSHDLLSPVQTEWGHAIDSKSFVASKSKDKTKRRSSASNHQHQVEAARGPDEQPGPDPVRIAVTSASIELLTRMFTPHLTAKGTADTRWEYFVSTMADTGCHARANGGCAVTFSWEGKRCTVHRPHPNPTINPIMLGSFGRKLSNGFGWGLETFVERTKEPR